MKTTNKNNDGYALQVSADEALVLFDFLSRFSDTDKLTVEHPSEEQALWNLCCILETELVEPFKPNYLELLQKARSALTIDE